MVIKRGKLEEKIAKREHYITDQGNGGSYCSNCNEYLGSNPSKIYEKCPGCDYKLIEGDLFIPRGGSDFD